MIVRRALAVWCGLSLATCVVSSSALALELGQVTQNIVNGEPSGDDQDAAVLIVRGDVLGLCTGAVVAPRLVLTARHCLFEAPTPENNDVDCEKGMTGTLYARPANTFSVHLGRVKPIPPAVAQGVRVHSSDGLDLCSNDVALLEVDTPLPIVPLQLRLDAPPELQELGTMIGWGSMGPDTPALAPARQQRQVSIIAFGPGPYSTVLGPDRFIGANAFLGNEGACAGDSGGPLIAESSRAIVGVTSGVLSERPQIILDDSKRAAACLDGRTVFHRVDSQEQWIRNTFRSLNSVPWLEGRPQPVGAGGECVDADDCLTGLCVRAGSESFCSIHCATVACPDGMQCVGPEGDRICSISALHTAEAYAPSCMLARVHRPTYEWSYVLLALLARRSRSAVGANVDTRSTCRSSSHGARSNAPHLTSPRS